MHPIISYYLAETLCDDKRRAALRHARQRSESPPAAARDERPRLRALRRPSLRLSRIR
jgi:hypothetical protein